MRLISSKQSAAKHKSYDLRCYCLLKGYERSEVEQAGDTLNKIERNLLKCGDRRKTKRKGIFYCT